MNYFIEMTQQRICNISITLVESDLFFCIELSQSDSCSKDKGPFTCCHNNNFCSAAGFVRNWRRKDLESKC